MSKPTLEIVHDVATFWFEPTPDRLSYPKDKGSPLLKRLTPRRPPLVLEPEPPDDKQDADAE